VSEVDQGLIVTLGELADEPVEQAGPIDDFVYIDISSIDRATKRISDPKCLTLSQAPSRAKQVLKAGDVLVSMTRPNLNSVALVPEHLDGAIGSTGFHVLRSYWLTPGFLLALVQTQSFIDAMSAVVQGALYPAVRPRDIAAFAFPFETPARQTRIVAKLEELLSDLDAGVAELKAAQKKLAHYRQSVLKAAVEGALTAEWRAKHSPSETGAQLLERVLTERRALWEAKQLARFKQQGKTPPKDWQKKYPEPVRQDTNDLPALPEGWVWASLDQLMTELTSGSRDWAPFYDRGTSIFVMAQNVRPWRPDFSYTQHVDPPIDHPDRIRSEIRRDDLLTTIVGANTGQACRVAEEVPGGHPNSPTRGHFKLPHLNTVSRG
jgi:type I restriction enzyme S subunit